MTLVTVPPIAEVPAPVKGGRIPRHAGFALVVWFGRGVREDIGAVRVEEGVEPAGLAEECVGLGNGRSFVRSAVRL